MNFLLGEIPELKPFENPNRELEQYSVNINDYLAIKNRFKEAVEDKVVLDACCGTGTFSLPISNSVKKLYFLDIDPNAIETLRENISVLDAGFDYDIIITDITKYKGNFDVILCNPPFGSRTNNLRPILYSLNAMTFECLFLLLPMNKASEAINLIEHTGVTCFLPIYISLQKTFDYHKEDKYTVRCVLLCLSRISERNCIDYDNILAREDDIIPIRHVPTTNLTPIRVGYILFHIFNGRITCVKNYQENESYTITLEIDPLLEGSSTEKFIKLKDLPRLMLFDRTITDDSDLQFGSILKSSLNSIFIVSEYLPFRDTASVMPIIHDSVCLSAAVIALKCCLIKWPNKLNDELREQLSKHLFPTIHEHKLKSIFLNKLKDLNSIIKDVCYIMLGNFCKKIESKANELTISEISYISREMQTLTDNAYIEFINSELPTLIKSQSPPPKFLADLNLCVDSLEQIYQRKQKNKEILNHIQHDLIIESGKFRTSSSLELNELKLVEFKYNSMLRTIKDDIDVTLFNDIKKDFDKDSPTYVTNYLPNDQVDLFEPEFIRRRKDKFTTIPEYNVIFKRLNLYDKIMTKHVKLYISRFENVYANKIAVVIEKFFESQGLRKIFNTTGNIRGTNSLSVLINFIYTNLNLMKHKHKLTSENKVLIESILIRVLTISKNVITLPVQAIVKEVGLELDRVKNFICPAAIDEYESLCNQLQLASTYTHAWNVGLRLKGLMYESFFSSNWNLEYIPEDCKHSLLTIVRHTMPDKLELFIKRTQKHPEIREFKPDFCLVKRPFLEAKVIEEKPIVMQDKSETTQLTESSKSQAKIIISKGKIVGWSEFGFDDNIKGFDQKMFTILRNLIEYGRKANSKGGYFSGNTGDSSFEHEDGTNIWSDADVIEKLDKYNISILEVGYQTDQEGKIMSDLQKWRIPINILQSMDIDVTVFSAVDKSSIDINNWWIKPEYVKQLKSTVGKLFSLLSKHSPVDVSEHIIGDIGSQKLRVSLRTGSLVRPPIITSDIIDYYHQWRDTYRVRPTGAKLPHTIESDFVQSNVFGSVVNMSMSEIEAFFDKLIEHSTDIISRVEEKHPIIQTSLKLTSMWFLLDWINEDLKNNKCLDCISKKTKEISLWDKPNQIKALISLLNNNYACPNCTEGFESALERKRLFKSFLSIKTTVTRPDPQIKSGDTECRKTSNEKTNFDEFVNLLLPGKTQKQVKIKNQKKKIVEIIMIRNKIAAIKDSKGQIMITHNSRYTMKETEASDITLKGRFSIKKIFEEQMDEDKEMSNDDIDTILVDELKILKESMGTDYSPKVLELVDSLMTSHVYEELPRCALPNSWLEKIFNSLDIKIDTLEYLKQLTIGSNSGSRQVKNTSFPTIDAESFADYLDSMSSEIHPCDPEFDYDCLIFKEIIEQVLKELNETIYGTSINYIIKSLELLLKFKWFNRIVFYSKLCATFMQVCSEYVHSGIKLKKILHTNLNLIVKVTEKKSSNMVSCIVDDDMNIVSQGSFFLNRRACILGQSLPFCYLTMFIQYIQMFNCCQAIMKVGNEFFEQYEVQSRKHIIKVYDALNRMKQGNTEMLREIGKEFFSKNYNINRTNDSTVLLHLLITFNTSFGIVSGPAIALNSQIINKQIQSIRYPMMLSLSEMGFEKSLGSKLSCSRRRVETDVLRCWLQFVSYFNLYDPRNNIKVWKKTQHFSDVLLSYSLCGMPIISDRHLVYDIYLVHLYNKELDDFDQGQIRVLDDFAERHYDWEQDVRIAVSEFNANKVKSEGPTIENAEKIKEKKRRLDKSKQDLRLLLGIPKLKTKEKGRDCVKMVKTHHDSTNRQLVLFGEVNESSSSSESGGSGDTQVSKQQSKQSDFSNIEYKIRSSTGYSFKMNSGLEVIQGKHTSYQPIAVSKSHTLEYRPSQSTVIEDILAICQQFKKHSFASNEFIQICTEFARQFYTSGCIDKARRSPRNWQTLTSFIETTSIISEPKDEIDVSLGITLIKTQITKKLNKLLKRRLDHSKDARQKIDKETVINYLTECMRACSFDEKDIETVTQSKNKPLDHISWRHIIKNSVNETLLSNDANKIYFWIKSLNNDIQSIKRKKKTKSQFKYSEGLMVIRDKLSSIALGKKSSNIDEVDITHSKDCWTKTTKEMIVLLNCPVLTQDELEVIINDLNLLWTEYENLKMNKQNFPNAAFLSEELTLNNREVQFLGKNKENLPVFFNTLLIHILCSPWMSLLTPEEIAALHISLISLGINEDEKLLTIVGILDSMLDYTGLFCEMFYPKDTNGCKNLIRYLVSMFHSNELPFKYLYETTNELGVNNIGASSLVNQLKDLKEMLVIKTLENSDNDFFMTILTMKAKNFSFTKKLLNKGGNDRLPRSTRSKVLFELTKVAQMNKQIILQQIVFSNINNNYHRNFASLAPKAQYGGDRDLLVQETHTKLFNAVSEQWSKSMLDNSSFDALVKPNVKEQALEEGQKWKVEADQQDNLEYRDQQVGTTNLVNFYKVYCAAADHKKWGPVHNTSTFNAMDMQLLKNNQDWCNFLKLINLKSLNKQIEIPASSISKILKTMSIDERFKNRKGFYLKEQELRELLKETSDRWNWKPHIKFLIDRYLSEGKCAINSYNHMGQGIHHAKSSLFGDVVRRALKVICERWFKRRHPELNIDITAFGSSDDMTMIIRITGVVLRTGHEELTSRVETSVCKMLNFWSGLSRSAQMFLSEKTVFSSCVNEMYSDFDLYHRVSPSVIKFTLSTIINSTINSPLSLYQSVHVSAQQASYMSTPFLTNLVFCICRQSVMLLHSENFYRKFGWFIFKLLAPFGGFYIPQHNKTIGGQLELDELTKVQNSMQLISVFLSCCQTRSIKKEKEVPRFREELSEIERQEMVSNYVMTGTTVSLNTSDIQFEKLEKEDIFEIPSTIKRTQIVSDLSEIIEENKINTKDDWDTYSRSDESDGPEYINVSQQSTSNGTHESSSSSQHIVPSGENNIKIDFINPSYCEINLKFCRHCSSEKNEEFFRKTAERLLSQESFQEFVGMIKTNPFITTKDIISEFCSALINVFVLNYYEFSKSKLGDHSSKTERCNIQISIEDPFLSILPERVRIQLTKLNLMRRELIEETSYEDEYMESSGLIARKLVEQNIKTEDFTSEMSRIVQIANSKNIQNGLTGGLKDNSIPNIRQVLRSYFMYDKSGIVIDDYWPISKDRSVKSESPSLVNSKHKVKYGTWLEKVLSSEVYKTFSANEKEQNEFKIYMQPKIMDTIVLKSKVLKVYLVINKTMLDGLTKSINTLVQKLITTNKATMKQVETSNVIHVFPAPEAWVIKSKLFSNESNVRFSNSPAVVIAHMIDHLSAASCKPVGVKYGTMESDKTLMTTHYPDIVDIITTIKTSGYLLEKDVKTYVSMLSNICRSITSSYYQSTPMYCFKPIKMKYEDSIASYINFNVVEGLELKTDENYIRDSAFSELYFRIIECVSIINGLPIADNKKSEMLSQFLCWNPKQYDESLILDTQTLPCPNSEEEQILIKRFSDDSIAVQLMTEAKSIKSRDDRRSVIDLANYHLNRKAIIQNAQKTDLTLAFKTEGTPYIDGRYQLSCEDGSSAGYFINGSLIVVMSRESKPLLRTLESEILNWVMSIRTAVTSLDQHESFINLLIKLYDGKNYVQNAKSLKVVVANENNCKSLSLIRSNEESCHCVFIKPNIMVEKAFSPESLDCEVGISWSRNSLSFYVSYNIEEMTNSIYMNSIIESINFIDPERKYQEFNKFKDQKVTLSTVKLLNTVSISAIYLIHVFLWHKINLHEGLGGDRKELLKQFFSGASQDSLRKQILEDKTLEIVNTYLLSERQRKAVGKEKEMNDIISSNEYRTKTGGKDKTGTFIYDEFGQKKYVDFKVEEYHEIYNQIQKERIEALQNYSDLPDVPSLNLLKELRVTLNIQNFESLIMSTQNVINRQFQDVSSWPFIKILLEELNIGKVNFEPVRNPIDSRLQWKIKPELTINEIKLHKGIYDAIHSIRTGSVPLSMSFLVFVKYDLNSYFNDISHLCELMSNLGFGKKVISACLALIMTLDKPRLNYRQFCYNWLDLLSGILPTTISNKAKSATIIICSKYGSLQIACNVFLPIKSLEEITIATNNILDTLIDNDFEEFVIINKTTIYSVKQNCLISTNQNLDQIIKNYKALVKRCNELLLQGKTYKDLHNNKDILQKKSTQNQQKFKRLTVNKEKTNQLEIKSRLINNLSDFLPCHKLFSCIDKETLETNNSDAGISYQFDFELNLLKENFDMTTIVSGFLRQSVETSKYLIGLCLLCIKRLLGAELNQIHNDFVYDLLESEFNPCSKNKAKSDVKYRPDSNQSELKNLLDKASAEAMKNVLFETESDSEYEILGSDQSEDEEELACYSDIAKEFSDSDDDFLTSGNQ